MKNVALIGASGFVGNAILHELLTRGHKVTAIVRNPQKIDVENPNLAVIKADVSDTNGLISACKGKDAVISAYNPGWTNPHIYEETLRNYPLILDAVKQSGVKRLLCVAVQAHYSVPLIFGWSIQELLQKPSWAESSLSVSSI